MNVQRAIIRILYYGVQYSSTISLMDGAYQEGQRVKMLVPLVLFTLDQWWTWIIPTTGVYLIITVFPRLCTDIKRFSIRKAPIGMICKYLTFLQAIDRGDQPSELKGIWCAERLAAKFKERATELGGWEGQRESCPVLRKLQILPYR